MYRTYQELQMLETFEERFAYLYIGGSIGAETFGSERYLNQVLYTSEEWKSTRRRVIIRDNGCDMGLDGFEIHESIHIHHLNPITKEQILNRDPCLFDLNNLICVSDRTHKAIHYGHMDYVRTVEVVERKPNDQCPWKH